jgi:hypothetical protein
MSDREYRRQETRRPEYNGDDPRYTARETYRERSGAAYPDDAEHEVYSERVSSPQGDRVVQAERVYEPSAAERRAAIESRVNQIVWFIAGLIMAIIAIRFVLFLLGANRGSGFFQFIYALSQPFVLPFLGLFEEPSYGGSVFESASVVAVIVYALVAYAIARLVTIVLAPNPAR